MSSSAWPFAHGPREAGAGSALDRLIAPEIKGDRFYEWLRRIAATPGVRHVLEIGASSGAGSTEALVKGALENPVSPAIYCIEVSKVRFAALVDRYRSVPFVHCYNASSVPKECFPDEEELDRFRRRVWTRFRFIRRKTVMGWLRQDLEYLERHGLSMAGIVAISAGHGIDRFDAVLIDGSEFTGPADLDEVYGARFLLLDDTRSYKNHDNHRRLARDAAYRLLDSSRWLRNGFAVFERRLSTPEQEIGGSPGTPRGGVR